MIDNSAIIFNLQRYTVHDGPGIRTTVFFKGCPLSCRWCSNPEGAMPAPQIILRRDKCIGCGRCVQTCNQNAISQQTDSKRGRVQINWAKCNQCLECVSVCPSQALSIVGTKISLEDIVKEVSSDSMFYRNSGGGVTASGGEPLYQWKFVKEMFKRLQTKGIHTALDTCGYAPWEVLKEVLPYTDLVLYDLKHMDSKTHKALTGKDNSLILTNAEKTARIVETWFRIPLIPGYNDTEKNIKELAAFAVSSQVKKVSLLIFHEFGKHKYEQIGKKYLLKIKKPDDDKWIKNIKDIIETYGIKVSVNI